MHTRPDDSPRGWASPWGQAAALVGLAGLAITQPVLDLLGRNPEFFVAGRYTKRQIVEFALIVAVVPAAVAIVVFVVARLLNRRFGNLVHALLLAFLGALFGNVLARGLGADGTGIAIAASVAGAAAALGLARATGGRLLLQYLAVANVLFVFSFLMLSPTSELVQGAAGIDSETLGSVTVPTPPGPVVVVVFDELPLATLMRSDGTINAERYPAFARLAADSTWYRNTSSVHERTERAVPSIVTGDVFKTRVMPSYQDLPRNLLSLMSTSMPVLRYEAVTNLCPPETCEARPGQPVSQALSDASVLYGHRVLPERLRGDLAPINDAWGSFGHGIETAKAAEPPPDDGFGDANPLARYRSFAGSEREPETQASRLVEQGLAIDATPALHFVHVVLPHAPWMATPFGTRLITPLPDWQQDPTQPGFEWSKLLYFQRHSFQVGAADYALGQVFDQLEAAGLWDDATIVVTADHGTSTLPPNFGRDVVNAGNQDEIFRVPLMMKAPGQTEPVVNDDVAMTIDILPTLIDLLHMKTDWKFDGHSLVDGSTAHTPPLVSPELEPLLEVVRRHEADFPLGEDWTGLAAVGEHGDLVGRPLAELEVGSTSSLSWTARDEAAFASVPNDKGEAPQIVVGSISGSGGEPPPALVLVVNGTVAGGTGGYRRQDDGSWAFSSTLGPFLVDGANQIDAYAVTEVNGQPVLHLLG